MIKLTFDQCFDRLIGIEGAYVNNLLDPGGETNWGISKRSYPSLDIPNLSRLDAKAIYFRDFWQRVSADTIPSSVTYQLFDFAVNSSCDTAVRYLQRSIGVADDGHFGPVSLARLAQVTETDLVMGLLAERLDFMTRLSNWRDAGKGWARRIAKDLRYAVADTD